MSGLSLPWACLVVMCAVLPGLVWLCFGLNSHWPIGRLGLGGGTSCLLLAVLCLCSGGGGGSLPSRCC